MKALYGLSNNNIYHVHRFLKKMGKNLRVQTLGFEDNVKLRAEIILVPTVTVFSKNRKSLDKTNAIVVVFDTPVLLSSLTHLEILDASKLSAFHYSYKSITPKALIDKINRPNNPECIRTDRVSVDVIPTMLNSTVPSVLKPILAYLYSLPNTEKRLHYRFQILRFLSNRNVTLRKLEKKLSRISKRNSKSDSLRALLEFLNTAQVEKTREILSILRKNKAAGTRTNLTNLCETNQVASFDINYIRKSYKADKKVLRSVK